MQCIPLDIIAVCTPMGENGREGQSNTNASQLLLCISNPQSSATEICSRMTQHERTCHVDMTSPSQQTQ